MDIRVINVNQSIDEIEMLRLEAFYHDPTLYRSIYADRFYKNQMLIIAAYVEDELVGALYFSPYFYRDGYVDQLFVRDDFQNSEYHVGTSLLGFAEEHIKELGDYFDQYINRIYIEYNSPQSKSVYINAGYKCTELNGTLVKKVGVK